MTTDMQPKELSLKKRVLFFILGTARLLGLFSLARLLTRRHLRIITYHGASIEDEHEFRGGLFISESVFKSRMQLLKQQNYPVLTLDNALQLLEAGTLPNGATVITIDDGWWGTASIMAPVLSEHGFPSTLYASTYYMERQTQVFNVAVDYVMWRSHKQSIDLSEIDASLSGQFSLNNAAERTEATRVLVEWGQALTDARQRQTVFRRLCDIVAVSWQEMEAKRQLSYMTVDEAYHLTEQGVDVQLHTHRHCLPVGSYDQLRLEIEDNRRVLGALSNAPLTHLCYPSGEYCQSQLPWLASLGITSGTTVCAGFNSRKTPRLELRRFLDWDDITDIEFEAEMSGFLELIRWTGYRI